MNWHLNIGHSWDDTFLEDVDLNPPAPISTIHQVFIHLRTYESQGDLAEGYEIEAWFREEPNLNNQQELFPRALTITNLDGALPLTIQNLDPLVHPEALQVLADGVDLSNMIKEVYINIDADGNCVEGWYTYITHGLLNEVVLNEVRFI